MTAYPFTDGQAELITSGRVAEVLGEPTRTTIADALERADRDANGNRPVELADADRRRLVDALHEVSADSADPTALAGTEQLLKTLG